MDFKIGYNVKPKEINTVNEVIFEEYAGVDIFRDVLPTKSECQAYGFIYTGGKCRIIVNNTEFIQNISTIQAGKRNTWHGNSDDSLLVGIDNTILSNCNNNLVVGNFNYINELVDNSITIGAKADTTATNSIVLAGNPPGNILAKKQSIQLLYGIQTLNGTNTVSFLNGITDSLFAIPENSVMYFHADVVAVRVGGVHATGAIGDYGSWVERGVIINKSGVLSINRERDTIKSSGTVTNWQPTGIANGTNFAMRVRGHADMTIEWASNITFTEIKTGVTL
tara:strand:+ start:5373 stop:6212 length:840 start_codon:yes stop_codon:yes gene_type:complete